MRWIVGATTTFAVVMLAFSAGAYALGFGPALTAISGVFVSSAALAIALVVVTALMALADAARELAGAARRSKDGVIQVSVDVRINDDDGDEPWRESLRGE